MQTPDTTGRPPAPKAPGNPDAPGYVATPVSATFESATNAALMAGPPFPPAPPPPGPVRIALSVAPKCAGTAAPAAPSAAPGHSVAAASADENRIRECQLRRQTTSRQKGRLIAPRRP